jgi:solute carrier family 25 (mitochondrial carnitine/acylcarnitine transporter), member 20/29
LTRMQANAAIQTTVGSGKLITTTPTNTYTGAVSVNIFRGMISNFGVTSLWRGSSPMIGAVPIQNALLMSGYGAGKRWSESDSSESRDSNDNDALVGVFVGGCVGGILQSFIMSPVRNCAALCAWNCFMFYTLILFHNCMVYIG